MPITVSKPESAVENLAAPLAGAVHAHQTVLVAESMYSGNGSPASIVAATVVPFNPSDGGVFKLSQGGKLTRVEAFSPVSNGTIALSSSSTAST